jgi:hypothetical protein
MKRLLDYDPATGLKTFHSYDEAEDKTFISYEQDVEPILDRNKAAANEASGPMGDMVPCGVNSVIDPAQVAGRARHRHH